MKSNIDRLLTVALVFAAVAVAGVQVNASLRGSALKALPDAGGAPVYVRTWEEVLPIANHVGGNTGATIRVVVFSDYECPVCKTFTLLRSSFLLSQSTT